MSIEQSKVESELYKEKLFENLTTLQNSNSLIKISFDYLLPNIIPKECDLPFDNDGDLLLSRRRKFVIELEHSNSTTIPLVGLQLWRGALVLADYILHNSISTFSNKTIIELGAGVGLTSIVGSLFAKEVIATDVSTGGILNLIERNFSRNSHIIKANVSVLPLNFYDQQWSKELCDKAEKTDIFLAADVIYDNGLTEAFVSTLTKILSSSKKKRVFVTLEKRYVFTLADLDCAAPCYEYFLESIKKNWNKPPMSLWTMDEVSIDFPKYFNYERTRHMVLWKIEN